MSQDLESADMDLFYSVIVTYNYEFGYLLHAVGALYDIIMTHDYDFVSVCLL